MQSLVRWGTLTVLWFGIVFMPIRIRLYFDANRFYRNPLMGPDFESEPLTGQVKNVITGRIRSPIRIGIGRLWIRILVRKKRYGSDRISDRMRIQQRGGLIFYIVTRSYYIYFNPPPPPPPRPHPISWRPDCNIR